VDAVSLSFRIEDGKLIAADSAGILPSVTVQAFRPEHDIFYHTPEPLTPAELHEEVAIHIPQTLHESLNDRVFPSTLGSLVLMQYTNPVYPSISPLAALREILLADGSVNSAILQADNGGLLFVRKAGEHFEAHASAHSLKTFLALPEDERDTIFPDFVASEIIMSGYDLDHFEELNLGPLEESRRIAVSDFLSISTFTEDALKAVELEPHLYTLCIGAASVFAQITKEAA